MLRAKKLSVDGEKVYSLEILLKKKKGKNKNNLQCNSGKGVIKFRINSTARKSFLYPSLKKFKDVLDV